MRTNDRNPRQALTRDDLRVMVPSAFALERCEASTSARYTYIPTADAIDALMREGFIAVTARQADARSAERDGYTKHQIIFRAPGYAGQVYKVGDTFPELRLINSHEGGTSWQLHGALYRKVCMNGMVVGAGTLATLRARHSGGAAVVERLLTGAAEMVRLLPQTLEQAAAWQETKLPDEVSQVLAMSAIRLRWGNEEIGRRPNVETRHMLQARRREDAGDDAWRTFNRVQENAINGGAAYRSGHSMRHVRPVSSISDDVRINRNLWDIAGALVGAVQSNSADLLGAIRSALTPRPEETILEGEIVGA